MQIKTLEKLDKFSGFLFFCANVSFKLRAFPIFSYSLNIISLTAYSLGYLLWLGIAIFYPSYKRDADKWYGFIDYKWQYLIAASLGSIATLLWIVAPQFFVIAAWIYVVSQAFWLVSELHKRDNPHPEAQKFSYEYHTDYIRYTLALTFSSLWVAINATMAFTMPLVLFNAIFPYLTIVTVLLALVVSYYWCCVTFGAYKAVPPKNVPEKKNNFELVSGTTNELLQNLGPAVRPNNDDNHKRDSGQNAAPDICLLVVHPSSRINGLTN